MQLRLVNPTLKKGSEHHTEFCLPLPDDALAMCQVVIIPAYVGIQVNKDILKW